ncbi:hypothetical protein, partial [Neisseria meningitidis]|uniref:hypothetical protein n=1 Tax=Neisseria meningitidis TaxID=487 RepID=UPI001C87E3BC
ESTITTSSSWEYECVGFGGSGEHRDLHIGRRQHRQMYISDRLSIVYLKIGTSNGNKPHKNFSLFFIKDIVLFFKISPDNILTIIIKTISTA